MNRILTITLFSLIAISSYAQEQEVSMSDARSFFAGGKVAHFDSTKSQKGVYLLTDDGNHSYLMDAKGELLKIFPFGYVAPLSDGIMVARSSAGLVKFDPDINFLWKTTMDQSNQQIHHEITFDENGGIYLLSSDVHDFMGLPVRFDVIKAYSPDGKLIYKWCLYDHLEEFVSIISKSTWCQALPNAYDATKGAREFISQAPDMFIFAIAEDTGCKFEFSHFNSMQVLPENSVTKKIPAFKKGNLLLSFNPYASYGIIDTSTGKIEWTGYLPERTVLHTTTLTPQGTILVFQNSTDAHLWFGDDDNSRCTVKVPVRIPQGKPVLVPLIRPWASITEYDPVLNNKVWEYTGDPAKSLTVPAMGSAQRMPNGNTLISLSTEKGGRIFEITPRNEIVWDYTPPDGPDDHKPIGFYRARWLGLDIGSKITNGFKE